MKALELVGEVDEQRQLRAVLPEDAPAGAVRVLVLWPEEDVVGANGGAAQDQAQDGVSPTSDQNQAASDEGWESMMQLIEECQVHTGIGDLAHQHDHYLYGKPKRTE